MSERSRPESVSGRVAAGTRNDVSSVRPLVLSLAVGRDLVRVLGKVLPNAVRTIPVTEADFGPSADERFKAYPARSVRSDTLTKGADVQKSAKRADFVALRAEFGDQQRLKSESKRDYCGVG
jgi:hypothetical protein